MHQDNQNSILRSKCQSRRFFLTILKSQFLTRWILKLALDDVLYTRLSQGISEIVETTTQDLEDFSEDEKKSEGYQEILKIYQDLKDLINHP